MTIAIALTTVLYGQQRIGNVTSGHYVVLPSKDTVRTFGFIRINFDTCRDRLIKYWGLPTQNTPGKITWTNKEIPGIGKEININLSDEFCIEGDGMITCNSFKDENDKAEKLKTIKPNQYRNVIITFSDKANMNLIMDKRKVRIILELINSIINHQ